MTDWQAQADELFEFSRATRRDLHMHPELAYQEFRTAGIVANELRSLGLEVNTGIAETGVTAILEGKSSGPVVLLRFDMDALPVEEQTGAEYASQAAGKMHACGHDGHVATGLTVARLLNAHRDELNGTIQFVFQPAEEGMGGAERMIKEGVLKQIPAKYSLALHLWNEKPLGWLGVPSGPLMASADFFKVTLEGKGGHGALPHQTVDPVAAAVQVISALQTIVSRNVSPLQSAVVSVTRVSAGETFNVIPSSAELYGTIRAFEPDVHARVLERFEQIIYGVAEAMGCRASIHLNSLTPPVINTPEVADQVAAAARDLYPEAEIDRQYRTMVSEDMAYFLQEVPGCFFLVGSANPERGLDYGHHHPKFDFDERALSRAAALMAGSVARLMA